MSSNNKETSENPNNPSAPALYPGHQPSHSAPNDLSPPPSSTQPDPSAPRYPSAPGSTQPIHGGPYNHHLLPQDGVPPLPQIPRNPPGGMYMGYSAPNMGTSQYGAGEAVPGESDPSKPPAASSGPENGTLSQSTLLQMLNGSVPRPPAASGPVDGGGPIAGQDQLLEQGPMLLNQLNAVAEFLAAKGDFANAIKYYERITGLDPENGAAWTALGHCYLLTEELQKAFTSYQKALYSLPDVRDPQLWYGIGLLYDKFETYEYAIPTLMSVLKLSPNFAQKSEVLYKLAVIFGKTYQLDHAINYFKLATLETSGAPALNRRIEILIKMAICYIEKTEYVDALRSAEAALNINDQNYRALQHVAWCEFLMEKYAQALEHIDRAISLKESDGDGYYIKGRIYMAMEKYPDANEQFKKAILHNHSKVAYLTSSGILNALTKLYKDAFDDFLKAAKIDGSVPEIWFNIGILYEIYKQYNEALVSYNKSIEIDPTFEEAIARKQALSIETPVKSPHPQFVQPEFHVYDSMVPMKSFIDNQKVKRAIEPCLNPQFTIQPPNFVRAIFNNNNQGSPTPASEAAFPPAEEAKSPERPADTPTEELKVSKEIKEESKNGERSYEVKKSECPIPQSSLPSNPKPVSEPPRPPPLQQERAKKEPVQESRTTQPVEKVAAPEQEYAEYPFYMRQPPIPGFAQNMAKEQPQAEMPAPQYTPPMQSQMLPQNPMQMPPQFSNYPSPPMPGNLPNNPYPSVPNFGMQHLGLLNQLSQLQALLSSYGVMAPSPNPYMPLMSSYNMQPQMGSGKIPYSQPSFPGNPMMNVGRMMQQMMGDLSNQYSQYPPGMPHGGMMPNISVNMPMYNPSIPQMPRPENLQTLPYMTSGTHAQYGAPEQPYQYAPRQEAPQMLPRPVESTLGPARPIPQYSRPGLVKPIPRISPVGKTPAEAEDPNRLAPSGSRGSITQRGNMLNIPLAGQEEYEDEKKQGEPNTLVKLSIPSNKADEANYGKRKRPEADTNKEGDREKPNAQQKRSRQNN